MKGRNNYLCRQKLIDLTSQPILNGLEEINQFRAMPSGRRRPGPADRSEIAGLPEVECLCPSWMRVRRRAQAEMPAVERCFITEMRRRAWRAT